MAKVLGLISPNIRGKIGNTVFAVNNGQTVARVYQPIVSNPKTPQQLINREAFAGAVRYASAWRIVFDRLYGTGFLPSFSALVQLFRNMPSFIQYKSFNYSKIKEFKNFFNTIGQNVEKDSIAAFDLTFASLRDSAPDSDGNIDWRLVLGFVNGEADWRSNPTNDIFFGSDYALSGLDIIFLQNGSSPSSLSSATPDVVSVSLSLVSADTENFIGERVKGFQTAVENCGSGWRYYYSLKNQDRAISLGVYAEDVSNIIATSINNALSTQYISRIFGTTGPDHGICSPVMIVGKRNSVATGSSKGSILLSSGIVFGNIGSVTGA